MQINKHHVQPHSVAAPKSQQLNQSRGNGKAPGGDVSRERNLTSGLNAVVSYTDQLQDIPEVRTDVVEAARLRFADGEYTTSQAAVETAAAILHRS